MKQVVQPPGNRIQIIDGIDRYRVHGEVDHRYDIQRRKQIMRIGILALYDEISPGNIGQNE